MRLADIQLPAKHIRPERKCPEARALFASLSSLETAATVLWYATSSKLLRERRTTAASSRAINRLLTALSRQSLVSRRRQYESLPTLLVVEPWELMVFDAGVAVVSLLGGEHDGVGGSSFGGEVG